MTLTLDDDVHAELKRRARARGLTMGRVASTALRQELHKQGLMPDAMVDQIPLAANTLAN